VEVGLYRQSRAGSIEDFDSATFLGGFYLRCLGSRAIAKDFYETGYLAAHIAYRRHFPHCPEPAAALPDPPLFRVATTAMGIIVERLALWPN